LWRKFAKFTSARVGRTASAGTARVGRSTLGRGVARAEAPGAIAEAAGCRNFIVSSVIG
jgi:hypothetical protein